VIAEDDFAERDDPPITTRSPRGVSSIVARAFGGSTNRIAEVCRGRAR
jgi:hypothetical protein